MKENVINKMGSGESIIDPNADIMEQARNFLFASIISADNDALDEETKQKIIANYQEHTADKLPWINWEEILAPIEDVELKEKYINLLD